MTALFFLAVYLCAGLMIVRWLLPRHPAMNRIWLGLSLGLLLMMWLPALCAFFFRFSLTAHLVSLIVLAAVALLAFTARDRAAAAPFGETDRQLLKQAAFVVLPLTLYSAWLQYTHVMRVMPDGSWHVGQSTYGDLPMHLSFITGLKDSAFPPQYPFYPGHRLCYPFLTDTLSTSLLLLGWPLQISVTFPAVLMMALCYLGVLILGRDMTSAKKAGILAALLFFLNGGLGFLYDFDLAGGSIPAAEELSGLSLPAKVGQSVSGYFSVAVSRIRAILNGFYKTPTNQPDPNNLRWSNVIADLMVPQRTLLGGWCMVLPCFYLLYSAFDPFSRQKELIHVSAGGRSWTASIDRSGRSGIRAEMLLAVWAGSLPLIHTHSFLALGLCSAGWMAWDLLHASGKSEVLLRYLRYAGITLIFAAPQLIFFTFRQVFEDSGAERSFVSFWFNWVNNPYGNGSMRDLYIWFYVKNIGLPVLVLIPALMEKDPVRRRLFAGALPIILAGELLRFQPNIYDNNKLLYLAWLLCCMIIADAFSSFWRRLKGLRSRPLIGMLTAFLVFFSAGLTLWREAVSDYQAFSADSVQAGIFVRDSTPEGSVFMTGTQHLNPVSSIAGRRIVCGPDLWLFYHGFDTTEEKADIAAFYEHPRENAGILDKYGVDYIYLSSYEFTSYEVDDEALFEAFEVVYQNREATIFRVPEG